MLLSGSGTLLQALLDASASADAPFAIEAVGSDRLDAFGLTRAMEAGVPTFVCPMLADRAEWDKKLTEVVARYHPDLVVSAGFMKLVGSAFLAQFGGRFINSHPALLPSFPGMHGVRDALDAGVKVSGTTIFLVDEGVDTGRILDQEAVRVEQGDTEESLHERIKIVERRLLVQQVCELTKERND